MRGPLGTESWDDTLRNGAASIEDTNAAEQAQRDQADAERQGSDNMGGTHNPGADPPRSFDTLQSLGMTPQLFSHTFPYLHAGGYFAPTGGDSGTTGQ